MSDEKDVMPLGFDWSTMAGVVERHSRNPVNAHSSALHNSVMGALDKLKQPPYPVNFHFKWKGRNTTVSLRFRSPLEAPRRDEPVFLTFKDETDGKTYRINSFAAHTIHNYYNADTLLNIGLDGLILDVWLKPVTIQPSQTEIEEMYREKYGDVPTLEEFKASLSEQTASAQD